MLRNLGIALLALSLMVAGCSSKPADDGMKPTRSGPASPEQVKEAQDKLNSGDYNNKPGMEEPRKDGS